MDKRDREHEVRANTETHAGEDEAAPEAGGLLWHQAPVPIEARPSGLSYLIVRWPRTEFQALLRAAREVGESPEAYVRTAVHLRREGQGISS